MIIKPEQLSVNLSKSLHPVYIVSGDEHLLVQEACQEIREAARNKGFSERTVFNAEPRFNWDDFLASGNSLSLFAEQKIIELRLVNGKPGADGSKAILEYLDMPSEDNLLLIITPKIDKGAQNSKWYKSLEQAGAAITIWPIGLEKLPHWIKQRLTQAGLNAEPEAIKMLASMVDGNLLAAAQEIEKLQLLVDEKRITVDTIREVVSDSSHFSVFNLIDTALMGDTRKSVAILSRLKGEGIEPLTITWALSREIRQLSLMAEGVARGIPASQVMQKHWIWKSRQRVVGAALSHLSLNTFGQLTRQLAEVDQMVKGIFPGNPWDSLESIIIKLSGASTPGQMFN